MQTKRYVVIGATIIAGILVIPKFIAQAKDCAQQKRVDDARQFEVWMDLFRQRICGEPQAVAGPAPIEQDPVEYEAMVRHAVERIENYRCELADELR